MSEIWHQLMALKAMTFDTGTIHDAQIFQLKVWAKLMFDGFPETEIKVAVNTSWRVEYNVTGDPAAKFPTQELLQGLASSVKDLLGNYFTVRVSFNGTTIFEDKGKPKKKRNLRDTMKRLIDADKSTDEG